jgi:phosphoglycolate phosphatase
MSRRFDLIIFDWDGTLMNSAERIVSAFLASIEDLNGPGRTQNDILNIIGLGMMEAIQTLYPDADETFCEQLRDRYRYHFLENPQVPSSSLFEGAEKLLQRLNEDDYLLAVATGKARRGLSQVFDETGMGDYFHTSRCADECFSKPHPQMIQEIMEQFAVDPERTLMIGDTEYDLQMANNAGVSSLGVSYGVHALERLEQCQPLDCVHSLDELAIWLGNHA